MGRDYAGGEGGSLRHWDDATFEVPLPATAGDVPVTVRLMYRATTKHYVEAIAAANTTDDRGRELLRLFNATNRAAPFEMASVSTTVRVTAAANPPDDGGGCAVGPGAAGATGRWGAWGLGLALAWAARRRRREAAKVRS